ncbi:MAG: hypothetical protein CMK29_06945 [Porticoccaceae bacterium]|nr:hypothetical protein [Porticoccaceae bacterium]
MRIISAIPAGRIDSGDLWTTKNSDRCNVDKRSPPQVIVRLQYPVRGMKKFKKKINQKIKNIERTK